MVSTYPSGISNRPGRRHLRDPAANSTGTLPAFSFLVLFSCLFWSFYFISPKLSLSIATLSGKSGRASRSTLDLKCRNSFQTAAVPAGSCRTLVFFCSRVRIFAVLNTNQRVIICILRAFRRCESP